MLNTFQEIFLVTYSILYGIMLNACMGQNLFPFGQICRNKKAKWRLLLSISLINLIPFLIFAWIFALLGIFRSMSSYNIIDIIGIFFISMVVFIPYRITQAIIVHNPARFYQRCEICRIFNRVPLDNQTPEGHIFGVMVYLLMTVFGLLILCLTRTIF